jgi:hypothetical protein
MAGSSAAKRSVLARVPKLWIEVFDRLPDEKTSANQFALIGGARA